jgi:hypothetical protein
VKNTFLGNTKKEKRYCGQATSSWGTVVARGIYDAVTGGDLLRCDYLGNYKWVPFTCTSATPDVMTTDSTTDAPANGSSIVVTAKLGGTLPTTSGSWSGLLTTAGISSNTFNAGVTTTSTGAGQFRRVTPQSIPANVTASFASGTLVVSAAWSLFSAVFGRGLWRRWRRPA